MTTNMNPKLKSFIKWFILGLGVGLVVLYTPWNKVLYRKTHPNDTASNVPVGTHVIILVPTGGLPPYVETKGVVIDEPKTLHTVSLPKNTTHVYVKAAGKNFVAPITLIKQRIF